MPTRSWTAVRSVRPLSRAIRYRILSSSRVPEEGCPNRPTLRTALVTSKPSHDACSNSRSCSAFVTASIHSPGGIVKRFLVDRGATGIVAGHCSHDPDISVCNGEAKPSWSARLDPNPLIPVTLFGIVVDPSLTISPSSFRAGASLGPESRSVVSSVRGEPQTYSGSAVPLLPALGKARGCVST